MAKKNLAEHSIESIEKQILENRRYIDYDTLEYPVEVIVSKYNEEEPWDGEWFIPDYQREFIWTDEFQSVFVESVLMNIPIPYMFLAEMRDGRMEVVDGSQRIRTLNRFAANELTLQGLKKLTLLNGKRLLDLPEAEQRKFRNRSLKVIKLSEKADDEIRRDLFYRINRSARVRDPEIRRGSFIGPFYKFVQLCAKDKLFLELCPFSVKQADRHEPEEYVLRYLCYKDHYQDFTHDVRAFLDLFVIRRNEDYTDQEQKHDLAEFKAMLKFVQEFFPYGFARKKEAKTSARVRFEALAIGTTLALRKKSLLKPKPVTLWLESPEFKEKISTDGSNSGPRLRGRIEFVRDHLLK